MQRKDAAMTTSSIGYSLGIGSGLDIKTMVDDLAAAAKAPKEAQLARREQANAAKISTLAEVSGAIDSFAAALSSLISGGTLSSQPSVSDPNVLTASTTPGARLGNLSATIEVTQLAKAQTLASAPLLNRADPIGQGVLTITVGATAVPVTIDAANDSLDGLAKAINDARAGVTSSIVTDSAGARLVVKGGTGAAAAFTLSVPGGTASGLERFAYAPPATGGMDLAQAAQDAIVRLDNVEVTRGSNSFNDLIAGVQIDLRNAAPGSIVSIGVTRPTAAITQAVQDFVAAYNELNAMIAEAAAPGAAGTSGPLRGDLGVRDMQRQLAQLPTMVLASGGTGPATLAEIGVRTNRNGTLGIDSARLQSALAADPVGVEAMFNPAQRSSNPLVTIKSAVGRVKPGVYQITDIVAAAGGVPASGKIGGIAALASGSNLIAPSSSAAVGLILGISGTPGSATITIDPGLGGALQAIRDGLRARGGVFANTEAKLASEAGRIADERAALETRSEKYHDQLLSTFTNMERQVSAFKATQSYLDQQIKIWTNDNR
jgi:flagellar hook-associated protein 2